MCVFRLVCNKISISAVWLEVGRENWNFRLYLKGSLSLKAWAAIQVGIPRRPGGGGVRNLHLNINLPYWGWSSLSIVAKPRFFKSPHINGHESTVLELLLPRLASCTFRQSSSSVFPVSIATTLGVVETPTMEWPLNTEKPASSCIYLHDSGSMRSKWARDVPSNIIIIISNGADSGFFMSCFRLSTSGFSITHAWMCSWVEPSLKWVCTFQKSLFTLILLFCGVRICLFPNDAIKSVCRTNGCASTFSISWPNAE